jgi:hypothetical protein
VLADLAFALDELFSQVLKTFQSFLDFHRGVPQCTTEPPHVALYCISSKPGHYLTVFTAMFRKTLIPQPQTHSAFTGVASHRKGS